MLDIGQRKLDRGALLRIAQVGAVVTPGGAFGGPVRVAVNQARELQAQGHEVTLFAGSHGFARPPKQIDGVHVRLFPTKRLVPGSGFLGLVSVSMLRALRVELKDFDVVHVHVGRDLLTLPVALFATLAGVPYVLQCHGMIVESSHSLVRPLDALLTRRVLRRASSVLYLTEAERRGLSGAIDPLLRFKRLVNGVPQPDSIASASNGVEVLFMARLHSRKRPVEFVEAAAEIAKRHKDVTFALVGPDEGMGRVVVDRIRALDLPDSIGWEGALSSESTLARMSRSSIYVLPSTDEPFPMSVLEAMSLGLPVIVTDSCGLAGPIAASRAGIVVDSSRHALVDAIEQLVIDEPLRKTLGDNARELVRSEFSMTSVAQQLTTYYAEAVSGARGPQAI